jgi:hypothetical protein
LAQATAGSVRLKLLKVAAQVRVSVRRVYVVSGRKLLISEVVRDVESGGRAVDV